MATNKETIKLYNDSIEVVFYPDSHRYKKDGEWLMSVTAITGIIDKSRQLIYWATGLAKDYLFNFIDKNHTGFSITTLKSAVVEAIKQHQIKKEEAASIGKEVHEWCENYVKAKLNNTQEPELPKDEIVMNGVTAFLQWINSYKVEFHESERMIYSKKYNYVGITDVIATVDGKKYIIDFKTSKGVYSSFYYQIAGYRGAYEEETGEVLDGSLIIHFDKETGDFEVKESESHEQDYQTFLACLTIKQREKILNK